MLFRIETVAWLVVGAAISTSMIAFGADNSSNPLASLGTDGNIAQILADFKSCQSAECRKEKADLIKLIKGQKSDDDENKKSCEDAASKFEEAKGKFASACGKYGLPSDAEKCAEAIRQCSSKDDGNKSDSGICPIADATDLDKKRDESQKVEDEIQKLKEKLSGFDNDVAELNEQANKQISDLNKHATKMQTDFNNEQTKRRNAYTQGMSQLQKQAVAQIQQMQQESDKITLSLKQIPSQIAQAQIQNYDQVVTKLRLDCHSQALAIVQKRQAETMDKIAKSQYNIGTLNNVIKTLGLTDEQRYELQAMYYEKKCLNDSAYVQQVNLADKTARVARQAIMAQRDGLLQQQSRMITTMNTAMQQVGLDKMEAYNQMQSEEQAARQSYTTEMGSLQSQLTTVQNSTKNKMDAINSKKQQLSSQIDQKNSYLEGKKNIVKLAEDLSGGKNRSKKDADDVNENHGLATGSANTVRSKCQCASKSYVDESSCESAISYLNASQNASYELPSKADFEKNDSSPPVRGLSSTPSSSVEDQIDTMTGRPTYQPSTYQTKPTQAMPPVNDDSSPGTAN